MYDLETGLEYTVLDVNASARLKLLRYRKNAIGDA